MGKYPRFWTSCSAELNISLRVSVDAVPESQCLYMVAFFVTSPAQSALKMC
jgi:hypothetical protein